MVETTYNYIGENVEVSGRILRHAMEAAIGKNVRIAPFKDELISKIGIWISGELKEVIEVTVKLNEELKNKKIQFHAMEWSQSRKRG